MRCDDTETDPIRRRILALLPENRTNMRWASLELGRDPAYLHQFIHRGIARILAERDRNAVANHLRCRPKELKHEVIRPRRAPSREQETGQGPNADGLRSTIPFATITCSLLSFISPGLRIASRSRGKVAQGGPVNSSGAQGWMSPELQDGAISYMRSVQSGCFHRRKGARGRILISAICYASWESRPCRTDSVRAFATGRPNAWTRHMRSWRRHCRTWSGTRWKQPTPALTCSIGDAS